MSDTFPFGVFFALCGLALVVIGFVLVALFRYVAEKGLQASTYSPEGAARVVLIGTQILRDLGESPSLHRSIRSLYRSRCASQLEFSA